MIKKPMLADKLTKACHDPEAVLNALRRLRYPVLGTPKVDGIRTFIQNGRAVSRTLRRVPNIHTRTLMEGHLPEGLDGEFWMPDESFSDISGAWRASAGRPRFQFLVFDYFMPAPYAERMDALKGLSLPSWCQKLLPVRLDNPYDVLDFEQACLDQGWEGVMLRDPKGPYKFGRSTFSEGWLLKLKRTTDAEARIVGVQELLSNQNSATTNALGHTERSGHRSGMVPRGTLGALSVVGINGTFKGRQFNIGTGFDEATRKRLWDDRESLEGKIVTYRYQEVGVKDSPRFPRFVGLRAPEDTDA